MLIDLLAFCLFGVIVVGIELFSGIAFLGWAGDFTLMERRKARGPFWFTITLHAVMLIVVPGLICLAK